MNMECPCCNAPYEEEGSAREVRVLPCGHSFCSLCLISSSADKSMFFCVFCQEKIDAGVVKFAPVNRLYYEMLVKVNEYIKQKEWESPKVIKGGKSDQKLARRHLPKYEQKCLYVFCQRKRYKHNGIKEPFCSQECKINHEKLYE